MSRPERQRAQTESRAALSLVAPFSEEDKRQRANQNRKSFVIGNLESPNCAWVVFKDFDLVDIPTIFEPSDYQRVINRRHVYKIMESIVNNTFYDNMIRVVKSGKHKFHVIDGQHRLQALWLLHNQYGVKTYNLTIQIFKAHEQREVYRKINAARALTPANILKTYDEGNFEFFNELSEYCTHNTSVRKPTYYSLLQAVHKHRKPSHKPIQITEFVYLLETVSPDELCHCVRLARSQSSAYAQMQSNKIFQSTLTRLVYVIGFENNWSREEYHKAFFTLLGDEDFVKLIKSGFMNHWVEIKATAERVLNVVGGNVKT